MWHGSGRMSEPAFVVFKGGGFPGLAHARPKPPHQVGGALQLHVYENFLLHYSAPVAFGLPAICRRGRRMRSGRCSSSSSRPIASCRGSATSASRSTIPRENRTVAYVPRETPGSPFSALFRVIRLMEARSARIVTGIRRRRRFNIQNNGRKVKSV